MPLVILNKPYRVLSQFTASDGRSTLADFIKIAAIYPAGRLDYDSEGLLLLTDDGKLQAHISQPKTKLAKGYWVQVDGTASPAQLRELTAGVTLKDGRAQAIEARCISEPELLWPRQPPIRVRKSIPTSWLQVAIDEGRNRQVRRMTAAVGLPTLRLIRHSVGPFTLTELKPGESVALDNAAAWQQLRKSG